MDGEISSRHHARGCCCDRCNPTSPMGNLDRMTYHLLRTRDSVIPAARLTLRGLLKVDRSFGLIDLCLALVAVAMVFTDQMFLFMQITFLLLMLGACYWRASG